MKKNVMILIVAAFTMLMAVTARAQTRPGFAAGADIFKYDYSERYEGAEVRDSGAFLGFHGAYTKTFNNGVFLRGRLGLNFGSVDYREVGGNARLNDVGQNSGQLELHAGRDFTLGNGVVVSPFLGLASRVLMDNSGGEKTADGVLGYDRTIGYRYVPVGAAATLKLRGNTTMTVTGQYNWVTNGRSESHFSDIDPTMPNVTVAIPGGSGYELSAAVNIPAGRHQVSVGPFIRGWNIDRSKSYFLADPDGSGDKLELFEPGNRTREAGVRVTFSF